MAKICVFCSARTKQKEEFIKVAKETGKLLAKRGHHLVYGGSHKGLMGELSKEFEKHSSPKEITEVIPKMWKDIVGSGENKHITEDIQERLRVMLEISDAFIALPGGIGTIQEIDTVLVSDQVGEHEKPLSIINTNGIFDGHFDLLKNLFDNRLIPEKTFNKAHKTNTPLEAIEYIEKKINQ